MSIIGNAIMLGGGGAGTKTVTLKGAPQSTISWTGADTGSVNTGNSGDASVALIPGTYTFVNTVTIDTIDYTAYTKTVAISDNAIVELFPEHIIYWYGRVVTAIDNRSGYSSHGGNVEAMTAKTNCVSGTKSTGYQQNWGVGWGTASAVDTTGFTELYCVQFLQWSQKTGNLAGAWGLSSAKSSDPITIRQNLGGNGTAAASRDGTAVDHVTITTPGSYYLNGYAYRGYSNQGSVTYKMLALWLE